jgi:hypothetical protein
MYSHLQRKIAQLRGQFSFQAPDCHPSVAAAVTSMRVPGMEMPVTPTTVGQGSGEAFPAREGIAGKGTDG